MNDDMIDTEVWKEVTDDFINHTHGMCVFMEIFKSEHRKLHELRITIDTLSDLLRNRRGEGKEEEGGMEGKNPGWRRQASVVAGAFIIVMLAILVE